MANNTTFTQKKRNLKYLNRDFESYKKDFIEHLKVYFPDIYQDFNEASIGILLTELMAYVGDNLSFYLDRNFAESFTETAREIRNILKHARQLGFKTFGKSAATGYINGFIKVPARTLNSEVIPDMRYAGKIKSGAKLKSKQGKTFEIIEDVDFSTINISDSSLVVVGDTDPVTNQPTTFVLKKELIPIKAGETKSTTFAVTSYEAYRKLTLPDEDVLEIVSVVDSDNNSWYEVEFLAQDTVFDSLQNKASDASDVPYVMRLKSVPYRFISQYDYVTNKTSMIFGTGDAQDFDGELIPNLADLSLPLLGKETFTDFAIDPQNFLKTRTLGLTPTNTTLTVRYRVGGGLDTNAGTQEINTVAASTYIVADNSLKQSTVKDVGNSFAVLNDAPIAGGKDEPSIEEIRQLIPAYFAAQSRIVTSEDFMVRALSMPSRFGSIFRCHAKPSSINRNAIELVVLSRNSFGYVTTAPTTLKSNLKTYLNKFRMMTDAIEILDGEIINIAVEFKLLTDQDYNTNEVLAAAIQQVASYFEIEKWQVAQPIIRSQIIRLLNDVPGVISVYDLQFINRVGTYDGRSYSTTSYNFTNNTKNGILYCKNNAIFEIKYPLKDIIASAK